MATRRVNPRLMAALQSASIEPLDYETPGRVVEVPVPAEHFGVAPEAPPVNEGAKPRSRFDVVREYLEANRQPMPQPTTPEVDVRAARQRDAEQNFIDAQGAVSAAFLGNRGAVDKLPNAATQETKALAEREARKRELEQWAAGRERQRMGEAGLLGQALSADEMAAQREAALGVQKERLGFDRDKAKTTDENADLDREARAKAAADKLAAAKAKAAAAGAAPDEVRFDDMTFQFVGPASTPKDVRIASAKKVREASAAWGIATSAMNDLESAMREFQKNPGVGARSMLFAPALTAAGAVNAAIGQGAMSDAEKQAQFEALGINLSDTASVKALLEKDPEGFVRRILGAKKIARGAVAAQARAYGYDPKPSATEVKGPPPAAQVTVREKKTGRTKKLDPKVAASLPPAEFEVLP